MHISLSHCSPTTSLAFLFRDVLSRFMASLNGVVNDQQNNTYCSQWGVSKNKNFQTFMERMNSDLLSQTDKLLKEGTQRGDDKNRDELKQNLNWLRSNSPRFYPPAVFCSFQTGVESNPSGFYAKFQQNRPSSRGHSSSSCEILTPSTSPDDFVVFEEETTQSLTATLASKSSRYIERRHPASGGILQRDWQYYPDYNATLKSSNSTSFTVVSYNVLCQETLEETRYLYKSCAEEWLQWDYRWNLLSKELANFGADILCLQEVEERYVDTHYKPLLEKLGFEGVFKKRTGSKSDGCAVYWRKSKFVAEFYDAVEYQVPNTYLDRDNVGIVVKLAVIESEQNQPRVTGERKLVVANTHLLFNPNRGDIKLCQIAMLLASIKRMVQRGSAYCPVIICGDFNSLPYCPLYNFVTKGELLYDGLRTGDITGQNKKGGSTVRCPLLPVEAGVGESPCEYTDSDRNRQGTCGTPYGCLRHTFNIRSAYNHSTKDGTHEVTTYHNNDKAINVDYIFFSSSNNAKLSKTVPTLRHFDLICKRRYALPDQLKLESSTGPLPNRTCGSDHLPLAAEFELTASSS